MTSRSVRDKRVARLIRLVALFGAAIVTTAACSGSSSTTQSPSTTSPTSQASPSTGPSTTMDAVAPSTEPIVSDIINNAPESGYSNTTDDYIGNPIWASGPGNIQLKADDSLAIRFVARANGISTGASYIIKYDGERDNYNGGDCGTLVVSLQADDGSGNPIDEALASTTFEDPCGGPRSIGWLTNQEWDEPANLIGGEPYFLVFSNTADSDDDYVSINVLYRPDEDSAELAFSTGDGQLGLRMRGNEFWSGNSQNKWGASDALASHYPTFEIHYKNLASQGVSYVGTRAELEVTLSPETKARLQQRFSTKDATTINSIHFASDHKPESQGSVVRVTVELGEGIYLVQLDLELKEGKAWYTADFASPITLPANSTMSVIVEGIAGEVKVRPLYQAQHDDWNSSDVSDWAGTSLFVDERGDGEWLPYVGQIPHDLSLYFTTQPTIEPTGEAPTVAILGDSLIGEQFRAQFEAALSSRGLELTSFTSVSGQTAAELTAAIGISGVPTADYIVLASSINGGESGPEFEASVRLAVGEVAEANPDSTILWVEAHALTTKYDYIVDDRVIPRNLVLNKLADEGLFELVPWASIAAQNEWIYGSDGVHFFQYPQLYALTIVDQVEAVR